MHRATEDCIIPAYYLTTQSDARVFSQKVPEDAAELRGFLYSHHQALTKYAPAEPLALSVAIGAGGDDPMIEKSVSFFERLQDDGNEVSLLYHEGGTEFFEPEHETDAAATKEIITTQISFLKRHLME